MKVHIQIPYSLNKRLAVEYNEAMRLVPEDDWICFIDHDVLFLTPDTIRHLHRYAELNPEAMLTCYTNRLHNLSREQILPGFHTTDIRMNVRTAKAQERMLYRTSEIKDFHRVSGFLMLISKRMWNETKFNEERNCLWVDTDFCNSLKAKSKKILRMDGIYVWHSYRIDKDENDKSHLL